MTFRVGLQFTADAKTAKAEVDALAATVRKAGSEVDAMGAKGVKATAATTALGRSADRTAADLAGLKSQTSSLKTTMETLAVAEARAVRQMGGGAQGAKMFAMQLSQVGQQSMATGNFIQALAIQLPDIGLAFGTVGIAVGLLAGVALPVLVNVLGGTSKEAKSAEDAVSDLGSALETYQGFVATSAASTADLMIKFAGFADEMRSFAEYMQGVSLGQALTDMDAAIDPLKAGLAEIVSLSNQAAAARQNLNQTTALSAQSGSGVGLMDVSVATDNLELFHAEIRDTATDFGILPTQALDLAAAIDDLGNASGVVQIRDQASEALSMIQEWYPAGAALSPEMATLASHLQEIVDKSAQAAAELAAAPPIVDEITTASFNASAGIAGIGTAAGGIIGQLRAAAAAAWNLAAAVTSQTAAQNAIPMDAAAAQYAQYGAGRQAFDRGASEQRYSVESQFPGFVIPTLGSGAGAGGGGGGGGGGGAVREERDAVAELIAKLQEEAAIRAELDPVQQDMLRYREDLAGATAEQRAEVEALIEAEQREAAATQTVQERWGYLKDTAYDALLAMAKGGDSASDALRNLGASLAEAAFQAAIMGEGPLGSLFGGTSIFGLIGGALGLGGGGKGIQAGGLKGFASGGMITGPGDGTSDSILMYGSSGEMMMNARAVRKNRHLLEAMNANAPVGYAKGGLIGAGRVAGGSGSASGGQPVAVSLKIDVTGARGNAEIMQMVRAGVEQGMAHYDRSILPASVNRIGADARRIG